MDRINHITLIRSTDGAYSIVQDFSGLPERREVPEHVVRKLYESAAKALNLPMFIPAEKVERGQIFTKTTGTLQYLAIHTDYYKFVGLEDGFLYGVSADGSACRIQYGKTVKLCHDQVLR